MGYYASVLRFVQHLCAKCEDRWCALVVKGGQSWGEDFFGCSLGVNRADVKMVIEVIEGVLCR